jgi:hypothetical protein
MRLGGASSDVDDALDDIVNNVQADYFVDKATNKTVKKSLKPGYARSRFEKSKEKRDLMSELYDHIHEDRSERDLLRPYGTMTTRVRKRSKLKTLILHPTGPRSESHRV